MCSKKMFFMLVVFPFFAWAGVDPASSKIETLITYGSNLGLSVTVLMLMVAGYKVLYEGETLKNCKNIFIGAVIIGGASAFGKIFY